MSILEKFLNRFGYTKKAAADLIASAIDDFILSQQTKKIDPKKAMDLYSGWVYACVRAIAEEIANIQLRLIQIKKDGAEEEIFDHELLDLLSAVNPTQTGYELFYNTAAHLELTGNAYWYLGNINENQKPKEIYILNPRYIKVEREKFPNIIKQYKYTENNQSLAFQPYQILHFKYPDPNDAFEGIGTVQSIIDWIEADNYATEFNRQFFLNGGKPGGFLESENAYTPAQLDYLRKSFEAVYRGVKNAHKVVALPKGTKYTPAGESQKDMDFVNMQTMMRDKILAGFRVPKTILGTAESETNRATAETANYVFASRTIKPKMQLIVSYLNEFLVPKYGDNLYLDFVSPIPEDRQLKIEESKAALAGKPYKTVNEVREEYGLPAIENGDSVMTDFSSVPLGAPKAEKISKPQTKRKISTKKKPQKEISKDIAKSVIKELKDAITSQKQNKKSITEMTDDEYEVLWKKFTVRVTPYEQAQKEAVKKFNAKQKEEVIKNLPKITKAINEDDLFDYEESVSALVDLSEPIQTELFEKEAKEAAALLGASEFRLTPEVRKAIKKSLELMSQTYNDTTLNLLKEKLEQGLSEGLGLDELKNLVADIYEFSDINRAEMVARTETFRIANAATKEAWKQSGVVKTIKWFTAADERVCPYCAPLHGKVISIEENFFEKGDEVEGEGVEPLNLDYADVDAPPLHVQCRCYVRPDQISLE
jgi:HK97 family phage portal protein